MMLDAMKGMNVQSLSVSGSEDKSTECEAKDNKEDNLENLDNLDKQEQASIFPTIAVNILNIQTTEPIKSFGQSDQSDKKIIGETVDNQKKTGQTGILSFKVGSETKPVQKVNPESQTDRTVPKSIPEGKDDKVFTAEKPKPVPEIPKTEKQFPEIITKAVLTEKQTGIVKQTNQQAETPKAEKAKIQTFTEVEKEDSPSNDIVTKSSNQIVLEKPKTDEKTVHNSVSVNIATDNRSQNHISVSKQEVKGLSDVNLDEVVSRLAGPIKKEALSGKDASFKIKLRPEGLGEVTVDLKHSGDNLSIAIKTEFTSTKELIETGLDSLKRALSDTSGQNQFSIGSITVENKEAGFGSAFLDNRSNNQSGFSQYESSNTQRKADSFEKSERVAETKSTQQTYSKAYKSGMFDYRA